MYHSFTMVYKVMTIFSAICLTWAKQSQMNLVSNVLGLQNSELNYISDFGSVEQLDFIVACMEDQSLPMTITDITVIRIGVKPCKELTPIHKDIMKKQATLFLAWTSNDNLPKVLEFYSRSVERCQKRVQPGNYRQSNSFIFLQDTDIVKANEIVFKDPLIYNHLNVAIVQIKEEMFNIYGLNIYSNRPVVRLLSRQKGLKKSSDIFPRHNMQGHTLRIGAMPYGSGVIADKKRNPPSQYHVFENYTGFEIDMLGVLADKLNFTYEILNPLDQGWGIIGENGKWSGMIEMLVNDTMDIGFGFLLTTDRIQVTLPSVVFNEDYYTLASPNPTQITDYVILFHPLHLSTWLALLASFVATCCLLYFSSRAMERWYGYDLREWSSISRVLLFTVGSAVDHSVMKLANHHSQGKDAIRFGITFWMLMTYIITAGYSSTLLSFFISPSYDKGIETYAEALQSKIPLRGLLYGGAEVVYMTSSEDPVVKKIWTTMNKDPPVDITSMIEEVYQRKLIYLAWYTDLAINMYVDFTTPDGQPLAHLSNYSPFPRQPLAWVYQPLNPWSENMNKMIRTFLESGLICAWKDKTLINMKKKTRKFTKSKLREKDVEKEGRNALTIDKFYSILVFLCIMYVAQIVLFVAEMGHSKIISWL